MRRDPVPVQKLLARAQHLLPHHALSRLAGLITGSRLPWVRRPLVRWFIHRYGVDLSEAAEPDPEAYASFQTFFTRRLRDGARPICPSPEGLACPADGTLSEAGTVPGGTAVQAKGERHGLDALLGGSPGAADAFRDGRILTVYLSPRDYHRVHMPLAGRLRSMVHVPGRAFSVGPATTAHIPGLFARNERVVLRFDTEAGPMAVVLVGAMLVATIATAWSGTVTPPRGRRVRQWTYPETGEGSVRLGKGDELGRFNLGSTVIVLLGRDRVAWHPDLTAGEPVAMGQCMGRVSGGVQEPGPVEPRAREKLR